MKVDFPNFDNIERVSLQCVVSERKEVAPVEPQVEARSALNLMLSDIIR
jgi:hypothetical protein